MMRFRLLSEEMGSHELETFHKEQTPTLVLFGFFSMISPNRGRDAANSGNCRGPKVSCCSARSQKTG